MQLLDGATLLSQSVFAKPMGSLYPVEDCYDLIAEGIQILHRMPVPSDATPGPYTADCALRRIRHPVCKDQTAPIVYRSVTELEQHFIKVGISLPHLFLRAYR